ncbi:O-antigen ligase family protein [Gemmata sp. G18]|uniref:O-antigen ligase family protein n=1 Tax=Gemmata palustris TaxID=2822762 RepID=A0ABS5BKV1_9BACT|nr:O-antigen ligase family protein [Gemmata palustris]MBP3954337.1 O-antigen ligase family protein [Gemmata palustris]
MRWLLIGYMFLFIERPFEVWTWLGDMHIERIYMLFMLGVWVIYPNKRFLPNIQHGAYVAFVSAVLFAWALSPWSAYGQPVVEDWLKIVVFYVLLVTCIHDEEGLKHIAVGFLAVMSFYLLHSFREYLAGRHTYRMGISRMIGVDTTLGDPNSFGASIVFALPLVVALWKSGIGGRLGRWALLSYVGLSSLCILLTGSRSSLLGLLLWFTIIIWGTKYRIKALVGFALMAPVAFVALPESLQTRFETIINPEVGPANARESGEGRYQGLVMGFQQWANNPLTGIGPGAWRPANHTKIESHNLYGQLFGETGSLGGGAFIALLLCFWINLRMVRRIRKEVPAWEHDLVFTLPSAIGMAVFLLLFMGNFGHNLFRFTWLWYGGFLIIARYCVERRLAAWDPEAEPEFEEEMEPELPPGWILHGPHG